MRAAQRMPTGYGMELGPNFDQDEQAGKQMAFNMHGRALHDLRRDGGAVRVVAVPAGDPDQRRFFLPRRVLAVRADRHRLLIMASIGMLVLMGVVVNNGIVMVEHINDRVARAWPYRGAGRGQPRTPATDPDDHGHGDPGHAAPVHRHHHRCGDGPPYYPMARAVVGGLAFSTVVSLLFLPTIYAMLDDLAPIRAAIIRARARKCRRAARSRRSPRAASGGAPEAAGRRDQPSLWIRLAPATHTAIDVPALASKKLTKTRANRLRHQPRDRAGVDAQVEHVLVGRLAQPGFDEGADHSRAQRRDQRRDWRGHGGGENGQRMRRPPRAQPMAPPMPVMRHQSAPASRPGRSRHA